MSTESPPLLARRLGYVLKQAQHGLRVRMDDELRSVGLTTPQYAVLCCVENEPGISNAGLARAAFVTPQTTQGIIANLERDGFVVRAPDETHGRILCTKLTTKGRKVLEKSHRVVGVIEKQLVKGISEKDSAHLLELLKKCAHNMLGAKL